MLMQKTKDEHVFKAISSPKTGLPVTMEMTIISIAKKVQNGSKTIISSKLVLTSSCRREVPSIVSRSFISISAI